LLKEYVISGLVREFIPRFMVLVWWVMHVWKRAASGRAYTAYSAPDLIAADAELTRMAAAALRLLAIACRDCSTAKNDVRNCMAEEGQLGGRRRHPSG